jgi:hypothetical protein
MLSHWTRYLVLVPLAAGAACGTRSDWRAAQEANTIEALESFLQEHPGSRYDGRARHQLLHLKEEQNWATAVARASIEAFESFQRAWPESEHAGNAQAQIQTLREAADWQTAFDARDPKAFDAFVAAWPESSRVEQIPALVAKLHAEQVATRTISLTALEWFRFWPTPLTRGITIRDQALLRKSRLMAATQLQALGRFFNNRIVPDSIRLLGPSDFVASMRRTRGPGFKRMGGGVGVAFVDEWTRPFVVDGNGLPAVSFRRGSILLEGGDLRVEEGTQARIVGTDGHPECYTAVGDSWESAPCG